MFENIWNLGFADRREHFGDPGVCNDNVQGSDAVGRLQIVYGGRSIGLGSAVNFHDDDGTAVALREVEESLGRCMAWVSNASNDGIITLIEIILY